MKFQMAAGSRPLAFACTICQEAMDAECMLVLPRFDLVLA
jgi:hypothetical protein